MSDKIKELFDEEVKECEKKPEGIPRTLCQLSVFVEKHPKLAGIAADVGCATIKTGIKHPKLLKVLKAIV